MSAVIRNPDPSVNVVIGSIGASVLFLLIVGIVLLGGCVLYVRRYSHIVAEKVDDV